MGIILNVTNHPAICYAITPQATQWSRQCLACAARVLQCGDSFVHKVTGAEFGYCNCAQHWHTRKGTARRAPTLHGGAGPRSASWATTRVAPYTLKASHRTPTRLTRNLRPPAQPWLLQLRTTARMTALAQSIGG